MATIRPVMLAVAVLVCGAGVEIDAAAADVKADFITGVWATEDGCGKLAKLAAGEPRNVGSVPETLTANGYETWEGGCTFTSITKTGDGPYQAETACTDAADAWTDRETMVLDGDGRRLAVTTGGATTQFVRCQDEKEN